VVVVVVVMVMVVVVVVPVHAQSGQIAALILKFGTR
jgi:hypothetical protein